MAASLGIGATGTTTELHVTAAGQTLTGALTLQVTVPSSVQFKASSGSWGTCAQQGTTITCRAQATGLRQWDGVLQTVWAQGAKGPVVAEVTGRYTNGSRADAVVGTTWPP